MTSMTRKIGFGILVIVLVLQIFWNVSLAQSPDWVSYSDPDAGLVLSHPPKWSASSDQGLTVVQDPLQTLFLIFYRFPVGAAYTASQCMDEVPQVFGDTFPDLTLSDISLDPSGTGASADLSYAAVSERGVGVVGCQIYNDKGFGILMMFGGVASAFSQNVETLLEVGYSITVDGIPLNDLDPTATVAGNQDSLTPTTPVFLGVSPDAVVQNISFTNYVDPQENAFSVDIPTDWTFTGGMLNVEGVARPAFQVLSPDNQILVNFGVTGLDVILSSSPTLTEAGYPSGSIFYNNGDFYVLVLDIASAAEYSEYYLNLILPSICEKFDILDTRDRADLSNATTDGLQYLAAESDFSCTLGGQLFLGYSFVALVAAPDPNLGVVWIPDAQAIYYADRPRVAEAGTVLSQMVNTFIVNGEWFTANSGMFEDNIEQFQRDFANDPVGSQYMSDISDIMNDSISSGLSNWGE